MPTPTRDDRQVFFQQLEQQEERIRALERALTALTADVREGTLPKRLRRQTSDGVGGEVRDWNKAVETGFWQGAPGTLNAPSADWMVGFVVAHRAFGTSLWVTQEIWSFSSTPTMRWRRYCKNNAWSAWAQLDNGVDSGWNYVATGVGFQNGWGDYGYPYGGARYRKVGGIVYCDGLINGPSISTAFTLPVGYRPWNGNTGAYRDHIFMTANSAPGTLNETIRISSNDGMVRVQSAFAWVSLNQLIFYAA